MHSAQRAEIQSVDYFCRTQYPSDARLIDNHTAEHSIGTLYRGLGLLEAATLFGIQSNQDLFNIRSLERLYQITIE